MLLVHKDISYMPITELENNSESVWVKVFANKTSHYVASWYRQPGGTSEDFQLFRDQLDHTRNQHKGTKFPSVHVLGDFNFRDIDWQDRLNKSGSALSQSEGQMLIDIMNDHGLEQLVHFPTREKNTLDLLLASLPGQFQDIHSPDKLGDHDIVAGTRDSRLRGTHLFSSIVLTVFQYACRTVRPDFRRLPIVIYIDKHVFIVP